MCFLAKGPSVVEYPSACILIPVALRARHVVHVRHLSHLRVLLSEQILPLCEQLASGLVSRSLGVEYTSDVLVMARHRDVLSCEGVVLPALAVQRG